MLSTAESSTTNSMAEATWSNGATGDAARELAKLESTIGAAKLAELGIFRLPVGFKLSVVMPVYNEARTIREIVARVRAVPIPKELVLVDDCSTDGVSEILNGMHSPPDIRVFRHDRNQGKGAALRTGLAQATGQIVLIQDADLEYDPVEYPKLIQPILDGRADVVYGSRFRGEIAKIQPYRHTRINQILTWLSNLFTNLYLTDMETCYKVFKREALEGISIAQNRFGFEPEVTAKLARRKRRVYEVPISYAGRSYAEGKKIRAKDALNAIYCIVRYALAD